MSLAETWRRSYISQINAAHVRSLLTLMSRMAMYVVTYKEVDEDAVPVLAPREGGQVSDAWNALGMVMSEYTLEERWGRRRQMTGMSRRRMVSQHRPQKAWAVSEGDRGVRISETTTYGSLRA